MFEFFDFLIAKVRKFIKKKATPKVTAKSLKSAKKKRKTTKRDG